MTSESRPNRETLFALAVTAVFLVLAGFVVAHHEMWRDEMGPWLIARDSASLFDIFHNIRYDGHPPLWYLLLWPLTRLGAGLASMQVLNLLICAGAVFLIARCAPAPRWVRAIAALGYFPVFEYGSVARNYSLGLLALAAFSALFPRRRERPVLMGLLLVAAANTSMLACLLALTASFTLAVEAVWEKRSAPATPARWGGIALAAAGIVLAVFKIVPPADSGYAMGWHFDLDPGRLFQVLRNLTAAYLPLPKPGPGFWETQLLEQIPAWRALSWLAAPVMLVTVALSLARRPLALIYYLCGSLSLLSFFYLKHVGYLRHHGFLFVCLATALWLAARLEPVTLPGAWDQTVRRLERGVAAGFVLLLAVHLAGALVAADGDYRYNFSGAKATAELIRSRGLDKLPLVADLDVTGMGVVGYLDKPSAYYPCGDRYGSYVIWDTARMQHSIVWEQAPLLAAKAKSPLVIVVDDFVMHKFPPPPGLSSRLALVGSRKGEIATEESYWVYLFDGKQPQAATP